MSVEHCTRAFSQTPDPDRFVSLPFLETALSEMADSARTGDGLTVLTGPWGSGKTQLATVLAARLKNFECDNFAEGSDQPAVCRRGTDRALSPVIIYGSGLVTRRSLHLAVLHALEQPYQSLREQEARLAVLDVARQKAAEEKPLAIILDEAHEVSNRILEELRAITNFVHDGQSLIRVVLIADNQLEERLATASLEGVNQRVICQATLRTLTTAESIEYIQQRLLHAGFEPGDVIESDAMEEVGCIAAGNVRAINVLAEKSIHVAAERSAATEGVVREDASAGAVTRVCRDDVIKALGEVESLALPWRRPLSLENESWKPSRRSDEFPQLEPLDGAVFEVGGQESKSVQPRPSQQADPLSPLRRMHEFIDDTGLFGDALNSCLQTMAEPEADSVLPADATTLDTNANTHASTVDGNDEAAVESDDASDTVGKTGSDDILDEEVPDRAAPFPVPAAAEIPVEAYPGDRDEQLLDQSESASGVDDENAIDVPSSDVSSSEQASDVDDLDELAEAPSGDEDEQRRSHDSAAERADSATRLLDAMLPLVDDDSPDDKAVAELEKLLKSQADRLEADDIDGDEDTLGGEALNLAAEVGSALQAADRPLQGHDFDTPAFAFDSATVEHGQSEVEVPAASQVKSSSTSRASRSQPESAVKGRRLEGLFTRLRRQRND